MCPVCSVNHVTSLYPYFSLPLRERVRVRGSKIGTLTSFLSRRGRGSLITSLPVTNQRRFLFVSAAALRASLRYCKHQKECRIRANFRLRRNLSRCFPACQPQL